MTIMTDLLPCGSTKYKERGACPGKFVFGPAWTRSCLPARGAGPAQKPGGGAGAGVKWPGGGGSGPRSGADLETPKTQLYQHASHVFCIFLHFLCLFFCFFFCISQTRSHFFGIFFAFPRLGVIFFAFFFAFPKPGVIFCIFFGIS